MTPKMCVISMTTQLSKPMRFICMDVIDGLTEPLLMGRLGHQLLTSYQMVGLRVPPGKFSNLLKLCLEAHAVYLFILYLAVKLMYIKNG